MEKEKKQVCRLRTALWLGVIAAGLACATTAQAQFICGGSADGSTHWGTFQGENGAALSGAVRIYHNVQLQAGFAYGFRENMAGGHAGLRFGF